MSDRDKTRNGFLMPGGRRDLAQAVPCNPLVVRGIADLTKALAPARTPIPEIEQFDEAFRNAHKKYLGSWYRVRILHKLYKSSFRRSYVDTVSKLKGILKLSSLNSPARLLQALNFSIRGEYDKAILEFDEIIRLRPDHAHTYFLRGMDSCCKNEFDEGIKDFDKALRLDPNGPTYLSRGMAWCFKREFGRAIADLGLSIQFKPNDSNLCLRGEAWCCLEEFGKGIEDFDAAIRLSPQDSSGYYHRGKAMCFKKDYDNAIKDYNQVICTSPDFGNAYVGRGTVWLAMENYAKASEDFKTAIQLGPENHEVYRWNAWLLTIWPMESFHDCKLAIEMATKACEFGSWNNGWYLNTLAAAYAASGQFDEAVRFQRKAMEDPAYFGADGDGFRQRLEHYKNKKPYRASPPQGTLTGAVTIEIKIPGEVSARPFRGGLTMVLAETPGIIEINSATLTAAPERTLLSYKQRLRRLQDLNAPEVIIQNEIRMINKCEEHLRIADPLPEDPEDYGYQFKATGQSHATGAELEHLAALIPWEKIDLSECLVISVETLAHLKGFANLRYLCLESCDGITDERLVHLATLSQLQDLSLADCSVTDLGLAHLRGLKNLRRLTLTGCDEITLSGVTSLRAALPGCEIDWGKA